MDESITLSIKDTLTKLQMNDIDELYTLIYNTFTPEQFTKDVFTAIVNAKNVSQFDRSFHNYYFYKIQLIFKIPGSNYQFILKQNHIEYLLKHRFKIKVDSLNSLWGKFFSRYVFNRHQTELSIVIKDIIESKKIWLDGAKNKRRLYLSTIMKDLYKSHKQKYGKIKLLSQELSKAGFTIKGNIRCRPYILI